MDRVFSVSACLAFLGLAVLVLFFTGGAGATNDPPPSGGPVTGDWTVTDTRAYNGVSITLSGNLLVENGGILVLDGARLVMDASSQGQYGIEVRPGGRLVMQNGANLTSSLAAYHFKVLAGGSANISDSELRRCGWDWGLDGETAGMFIASDGCTMARTLVSGGYYGVVVRGASPAFSRCVFSGNSYGSALVNSSSRFDSCTFTYNTNGANLENCSGIFTGCTFAQNTGFGLLAYRSSAAFSACGFISNPSGNCVLMGSEASFLNCTFRDGAYGAYVTQGRPSFSGCQVSGNRYGMYFYKSSAAVNDSTFARNSWYGVSCYFGEPALERCSISRTGWSDVDGVAYGTGVGAFSSNFSISGGSVSHNYQGVECRYGSPRLSGVEFSDNDLSAWGYQTAMRFTSCNFTRARTYGAQLQFFCGGYFEGCRFQDSLFGAYLDYYSSTAVLNSTFTGCRWALKLETCGDDTDVRGCLFDKNGVGGYIVGSSSRIVSNRFGGNLNGSMMCFGSKMTVAGNTFSSCEADALQLNDCGGLVDGNTFVSNNATGVYCLDSRTEISNNTFKSNGGSGIHITGKKADPNVHDNTFGANALGVAFTKQSSGSVHHNMLIGNAQAGITFAASTGDIHCNTVAGSARGISCDAGSSPSIRGNSILANEGGVVCHSSSNAAIQGNDLRENTRFGIEAVDAWPSITGNTIAGSRDGIRVQSSGSRAVEISGNLIMNNTDGVWAENALLEVRDCNFTGNTDAGILASGTGLLASRCTFLGNEDGMCPSGGAATAEDCEFIQNNNSGILAEQSAVLVRGCFFFQNTDGVMDLGNSTLDVFDGVYEQNAAYALYWSDTTTGDWRVEGASSSLDDRFRLAGSLTVSGGGSLRLVNATVFMLLERPGEHSIEVQNGGRLEILQGSLVTAATGSERYGFSVESGGNLTFTDGTLEQCGRRMGGNLAGAGLTLMSSQVLLRGVTFRDCDHGLIASGITARFQYLTFIVCELPVLAVASELRIDNSTIYSREGAVWDLELQQAARVMLVNTTVKNGLDRPSANLAGPGCELSVYWYLWVNVAWQNKVVAPRAQITLESAAGGRELAGLTDEKGWLQWVLVLQSVQNSTARRDQNPYTLGARLGNVTTEAEHAFLQSFTWYCELRDRLVPYIQIDSPAPGARLNSTPVAVSGLAADFETGLERLEWSTDGRVYAPAAGTNSWTASAALPDGNHTVHIRATDAVGNQAFANVSFSVKTRINVLVVNAPAEGLLTRNPVLLVTGVTDLEARIMVNGRDAGASLGRFSATVYLSEGNNTVLVTAEDDSGNTATVARRVVLDTLPPFIEMLSPRNGSYINTAQARLSGRTEPGANVFVGGQPVINSDGRFSLAVDLPNETNTIEIAAHDAAGNQNTTLLEVHVDLVPPAITVGYPRMGQHLGRRNLTLNGTTEPFATVTAGDFTGVAGADGAFRMNVTLLYGNNTLIIRSTDRAGNFETVTWYVVRDRPSPGPGSPWMAALAAFAVILAAENAGIYLYWRNRRGMPPAAPPPGAPPAPPAASSAAAEAEVVPVADAVAVAGAPPEALPVGDDEPVETVDMK